MKEGKIINSRSLFLLIFLMTIRVEINGQEKPQPPFSFGGGVTVTNNGISLIPNLTLDKPAAIFDMNAGRRITFEPQFRFALEGKPWSFIFWWRYKLLQGEKFRINIGAHPAFMFRTGSFLVDTVYKDLQTVSRYLAAELYPQYSLWDNISIGTYFLRAYCLEKDAIKNTTLMALRLNFTKISLSEKVYLRLLPQVYYLRLDDMDGFYFTSSASLAKTGFPFYLSSIISTPFRTSIPQKNNFVWNFSLTWTFNKALVEKQGIL